MADILEIDGAQGEGGGQILRTSFALAAITGRPIRIAKIRAGRPKPGLAAQHLTAIEAAAEVCGGGLVGGRIGAKEVAFTPAHAPKGGDYHFRIGTAGSTTLVAQTVLWPLCFADRPSRVVIEGGTHALKAPPIEFLTDTFLPAVRKMGVQATLTLERYGFYPQGGGRIVLEVEPITALRPAQFLDRGKRQRLTAYALVAQLRPEIAETEVSTLGRRLQIASKDRRTEVVSNTVGAGNVVLLSASYATGTLVFSALGERGKPADKVALAAAREFERFDEHGGAVDEHLADQLVIPMALAGGGAFRTGPLSLHTTTNMTVVSLFCPTPTSVQEAAEGATVTFGSPSA